MSKRLQVVLDEKEYREIKKVARRKGLTVSEWVRQSLRDARAEEPTADASRKLNAVRAAVEHDLPTADIDQMLRKIQQGYVGDPD